MLQFSSVLNPTEVEMEKNTFTVSSNLSRSYFNIDWYKESRNKEWRTKQKTMKYNQFQNLGNLEWVQSSEENVGAQIVYFLSKF